MKTDKQMAAAAADFAQRWEGKGYERGESQLFWADLLTNVYGVENLPSFLRHEEQVADRTKIKGNNKQSRIVWRKRV